MDLEIGSTIVVENMPGTTFSVLIGCECHADPAWSDLDTVFQQAVLVDFEGYKQADTALLTGQTTQLDALQDVAKYQVKISIEDLEGIPRRAPPDPWKKVGTFFGKGLGGTAGITSGFSLEQKQAFYRVLARKLRSLAGGRMKRIKR